MILIQEEVENKVVIVMTNCSKLTARELKQAMSKILAAWKHRRAVHKQKQEAKEAEPAHGKMTVKELAAKDKGMQSIEVNDSNIGSFNRIARKYGIDFAPYKVKGEKKYLIIFKAPDVDAMTAAFTEYTQKEVKKASRPSIRQRLAELSLIKRPTKDTPSNFLQPMRATLRSTRLQRNTLMNRGSKSCRGSRA